MTSIDDFAETVHRLMSNEVGGDCADSDMVSRLLKVVPGWPFPANDPRAPGLVEVLAKLIVWSFDDLKQADPVASILAKLSPGGDRWLWSRLCAQRFSKQWAEAFRDELNDSGQAASVIIPGLLNSSQPMVIAGPEKCCKTRLSIDLAAALTTATPFLGRAIDEPVNVLALTAETISDEWRDRFVQAVKARGCDIHEPLSRLSVTGDAKLIRTKAGRQRLEGFLRITGPSVAILDPVYQLVHDHQTTDQTANGRALRRLVKPVIEGRATPVLVHHFLKSTEHGTMPTLRDLAGAGIGPFVRSWLLVNRQSEYQGGGVHDLLALIGTSSGDHSRLRMTLDEAAGTVKADSLEAVKKSRFTTPKRG